MQNSTFGPRIQYVKAFFIIILTSFLWTGTDIYAQEITFISEDPTCSDASDGSIDISVSGGTTPYSYSWSGPNVNSVTTQDINNLIVGTYTITVTDASSSTAQKTITLNYDDNISPTAVARNLTIQLDNSGLASIAPSDIDNGSTDNCAIDFLSLNISDFSCNDVGANNVILTVTDVNNNTDTATATVTVEDNVNPVAITQDITVQLDNSGNVSIAEDAVNNGSTDACGGLTFDTNITDFDCNDVGPNTVTLTVTDENGNTDTATATVTVEDNINPVAITQDIVVQLDNSGNVSIAEDAVNNGSTDACGGLTFDTNITDFDCNDVGPNTVTLTVTDENGNTDAATATVTVEDNINPVAIPQDITVQLDNSGNVSIAEDAVNNGSTDACGGLTFDTNITDFDCNDVGPNTVTLTVIDENGNTDSATAIVTVEDNTAPTVITKNITIQLDSSGNASITEDAVNDGSSDICGGLIYDTDITEFDCSDVGDNTVTLTIIDANNNSETSTAIVTVEDDIIPVITAGGTITGTNDTGLCEAGMSIAPATATDNCNIGSPIGTRDDGLNLNDPYPVGTTIITWNVQDENGNVAESVTQTVIVEDNEAPALPDLEDITWGCEYTVETPVAIDNCEGEITGVPDRSTTFSSSGTIIWTFTDSKGNESQVQQEITIVPIVAEITFEDIECNGFDSGQASVEATGGVGVLQYEWAGLSGSGSTQDDLAPGDYSVTVTDANGCFETLDFSITEPDALEMTDPSSTPATCFDGSDGSITVGNMSGGTPPYQFSLDNDIFQSELTFEDLAAGNYTIFVTDANGCAMQKTVSVSQPELMGADLSKTNVTCYENTDGTITVSNPEGGSGNYRYSLDGTSWQDSNVFSDLAHGFYSVYIQDTSNPDCQIIINDNYEITRPENPLEATVTTTNTTEFGTPTGSATANPTGGTAGYTYEWRASGEATVIKNTKTANELPAGDYTVTITDSKGCSIEKTVTILEVLFAAISPKSICEGDTDTTRTSYYTVDGGTAQGGIGPYTYSWDFGTGSTLAPTSTTDGSEEFRVDYNDEGVRTISLKVTDEGTGNSKTFQIEQYIGTCFRNDCGSNDIDVTDFYIGDENGNEIGPLDCTSLVDKYLYLSFEGAPTRYSLYIEVKYVKQNVLFGGSPEALQGGGNYYCKEAIPDKARLFKIDNWSCGEEIKVQNVYLTFQNNIKRDCGYSQKPKCYGNNSDTQVNTPLVALAKPNEILCNGAETGTVNVTAAGGAFPYDYFLENVDTGAQFGYQSTGTFSNLPAGTYTATVRDSKNTTFETDPVTIEQPDETLSVVPTITTDIACYGGFAEVNAAATGGTPFTDGDGNPYYEYLWNDPEEQTTATATDLPAGNYTVTVIDANGCQVIADVEITEPEQLTVAETGDDQSFSCGYNSTILEANTPETGTGTWTIISGNGGNLTDPNDPNTGFTGSNDTYVLRWTIAHADGTCETYDELSVTFENECSTLDFDGLDDHVLLDDNYGFNSGSFSIEVWVKPKSVNGIRTILSKRDVSSLGSGGYDLIINNGAPTFRYGNSSVSTSSKVSTDRWYHIAVIYRNAKVLLFVDGIQVGNKNTSNPASITAPAVIGAMYDSGSPDTPKNYFHGWIEELRIWNTSLTDEQLRYMMNQRVDSNNGSVKGDVLPMDVPGNLLWSNLQGYYRMMADEINNGETPDISSSPLNGYLRNIETSQENTAPLPYISNANGSWRSKNSWLRPSVWDVPNAKGINNEYINWNIVRTNHDLNSGSEDIYLLGLLSESGEIEMTGNVNMTSGKGSGNGLTITHYLKLDGVIDLNGESQLVQIEGSELASQSSGYIEIDQQGTANSFNYNYWTPPVSLTGSTNNSGFKIDEILMDGTNATPQGINFNYQFHWADGNYSGNKRISTYWLYVFQGTADDYFQWQQISESEVIDPGIGYSMKGTQGYVPVSNKQNYTFRGKPNNGNISVSVGQDQNLLTGNPYPSAIDANLFIQENLSNFNGSIYYWDHFGPENSHYLEEYVGGYAVYNLSGGITSASSIDSRINDNNDRSNKDAPGKYIPVGQAFFINTIGVSNPQTVTYKNKYRAFVPESTGDSQFHSQEDLTTKKGENSNVYKKDSRFKIRLKFESPKGYHRQILATADGNSTNGFDLGYDAPLIENNLEDMYWLIDETEFVIQAVPNFNLDQVLPFGIKVSEPGEYKIKIDKLENIYPEFNVYLFDKKTEEYFNIAKEDYTTETEETGFINDRYQLVFKKPQVEKPEDKIEELLPEDTILGLQYLKDSDEISLLNPDLMKLDFVELYSISGQKIKTFTDVPNKEKIFLRIERKLSSAVYIVKVYSGSRSYSKKIIITK
ncbi:T9SS type A sorting domain-containing protein [Gramella lutea]|uniref:T9SS type A sorting domain-containing protein n=1 Tax=Christiangramia lutea TaxID=1607951 RepID=A0A9X1V136_9FLAO|nr:LamG-like jellyroll fold domain-containing protein [Christiangramia lutea]MCH4821721.1 T9SS type A sorting domain-containing protein [Christiangramia lutea]